MAITVSREMWNNYIKELRAIDDTASKKMEWWIRRHYDASMDEVIEYAKALSDHYGSASAELAAEMYDALAEASGETLESAFPASTATYSEVAKAINGTKNSLPQRLEAISRLVRLAGQDTMLKNAQRDGAHWAWIPAGDTCAFCITLASRGWQPASKAQLKGDHASHIHAHCDCAFCIRFGDDLNVEGYNTDEYLEMYENADTSSYGWGSSNNNREVSKRHWQSATTAKMNGMRRMQYAQSKDIINAQKREAYAQARKIDIDFGKETEVTRNFEKIKTYFVPESKHGVYVSQKANVKKTTLSHIDRTISVAYEKLGIEDRDGLPEIYILSREEMGSTFAAYNPGNNQIFISESLGNRSETVQLQKKMEFADPNNPDSTSVHEYIHWMDADNYRKNVKEISNAGDVRDYLDSLREECKKELDNLGINADNVSEISGYAQKSYLFGRYDEVYTEYRTLKAGK